MDGGAKIRDQVRNQTKCLVPFVNIRRLNLGREHIGVYIITS